MKVRIAVAVDHLGCVGVSLIDSRGAPEDVAEAFSWCIDALENGEARYIIEADVPLPEVSVIQATVSQA